MLHSFLSKLLTDRVSRSQGISTSKYCKDKEILYCRYDNDKKYREKRLKTRKLAHEKISSSM